MFGGYLLLKLADRFRGILLGSLKAFDRLLESSQGLSSRFVSYFPRCWWLCGRLSYYGRFAHTLVIRPKECPADGDDTEEGLPRYGAAG